MIGVMLDLTSTIIIVMIQGGRKPSADIPLPIVKEATLIALHATKLQADILVEEIIVLCHPTDTSHRTLMIIQLRIIGRTVLKIPNLYRVL